MNTAKESHLLRIQVGPSRFGSRSLLISTKQGDTLTPLLVTRKKSPSVDTPLREQTIIISDARSQRDLHLERGAVYHVRFDKGTWKINDARLNGVEHSPGTYASRPIKFSLVSPSAPKTT